VDLLVGTQMIAKGLDFPNVTLVGVVDADTGLYLPDFRSGERTFQLLAQVAGRAGGGLRVGRCWCRPGAPASRAVHAAQHDTEGFSPRRAGAAAGAAVSAGCSARQSRGVRR
jgi:primosomal protein N' (replication factor Y)